MTNQRGRFYLSRVLKLGQLTQERLIAATLNAPILRIGKFNWTITDAFDGTTQQPKFIFGKLSKYSSEGHVRVVDPTKKSQKDALARNLLVASSPFVYLLDYSGIAFLHVWNGIQEDLFPKRYCAIIQEAYQSFFVECSVEPVADYQAFVEKLDDLDKVTEMSAKVHPPNPLFGHLWRDLRKYIERRNAEEISIRERKPDGNGIKTQLKELMEELSREPELADLQKAVDVTDAALLMAADGYGKGKVVGEKKGEEIVIRTSDTHKSFLFSQDPEPADLAKVASKHFKGISRQRRMRH